MVLLLIRFVKIVSFIAIQILHLLQMVDQVGLLVIPIHLPH